MFRLVRLGLILSSALITVPAAAQLMPGEAPTEEQIQSGEVLSAQPAPPAVEAVPVVAAPPMPVAKWERADVEELLAYVERLKGGSAAHVYERVAPGQRMG